MITLSKRDNQRLQDLENFISSDLDLATRFLQTLLKSGLSVKLEKVLISKGYIG